MDESIESVVSRVVDKAVAGIDDISDRYASKMKKTYTAMMDGVDVDSYNTSVEMTVTLMVNQQLLMMGYTQAKQDSMTEDLIRPLINAFGLNKKATCSVCGKDVNEAVEKLGLLVCSECEEGGRAMEI